MFIDGNIEIHADQTHFALNIDVKNGLNHGDIYLLFN
jgi:hypothetical protein